MTQGYQDFQGTQGFGSGFNAHAFLVQSILATVRTAAVVQVQSCTNAGGVSPVGTVVVVPLTNMVDGAGNTTPHAALPSLSYARVQGGLNAVIIDPQPGDIGVAIFCDRDITSTMANAQGYVTSGSPTVNNLNSPPGSGRTFDMADGIYLFTIAAKAPTQYVEFNSTGITITTPGTVTVNAVNANVNASTEATIIAPTTTITASSGMTINANVTVNGTVTATGEGTFNGGHTVSAHKHGGVTSGGSQTATPTG